MLTYILSCVVHCSESQSDDDNVLALVTKLQQQGFDDFMDLNLRSVLRMYLLAVFTLVGHVCMFPLACLKCERC